MRKEGKSESRLEDSDSETESIPSGSLSNSSSRMSEVHESEDNGKSSPSGGGSLTVVSAAVEVLEFIQPFVEQIHKQHCSEVVGITLQCSSGILWPCTLSSHSP